MTPDEITIVSLAASYLVMFYMIKWGHWIPGIKKLVRGIEEEPDGGLLLALVFIFAPVTIACGIIVVAMYLLARIIKPIERE